MRTASMLARDAPRHDADTDAVADHDADALEGLHADAHVQSATDVARLVFDVVCSALPSARATKVSPAASAKVTLRSDANR